MSVEELEQRRAELRLEIVDLLFQAGSPGMAPLRRLEPGDPGRALLTGLEERIEEKREQLRGLDARIQRASAPPRPLPCRVLPVPGRHLAGRGVRLPRRRLLRARPRRRALHPAGPRRPLFSRLGRLVLAPSAALAPPVRRLISSITNKRTEKGRPRLGDVPFEMLACQLPAAVILTVIFRPGGGHVDLPGLHVQGHVVGEAHHHSAIRGHGHVVGEGKEEAAIFKVKNCSTHSDTSLPQF